MVKGSYYRFSKITLVLQSYSDSFPTDTNVYIAGGEEMMVGVGDNAILQCKEAAHQAVTSVEWFCRSGYFVITIDFRIREARKKPVNSRVSQS